MTDTRKKDMNWTVHPMDSGNFSYDAAQLAVLMDLRDEMKKMNSILNCPNFLEIPAVLQRISRNTTKPRKKS